MENISQKIFVEEMQFLISGDYFKANSLPEDPPGSVVYEKDTAESTDILMFFFISKDEAMPFHDTERVINSLHRILGDEQGLIEVKKGLTGNGITFVYTVIKTLKQPSGVQYILTLQLDMGIKVLNVQGYFDEENITGIRDAAIWEYAVREGIISDNDQSKWRIDPYCPDYQKGALMNLAEQEQFDVAFPSHPLSELRSFVRFFVSEN